MYRHPCSGLGAESAVWDWENASSYPLLKDVSGFLSKNTHNWMLVLKMSSYLRIALINVRNCSHCQDVLPSYFWAYFGGPYFSNIPRTQLCLGRTDTVPHPNRISWISESQPESRAAVLELVLRLTMVHSKTTDMNESCGWKIKLC